MEQIKKTKNIWSVVCKKSIVDNQTQLMSLIDIVEKLILDIDIGKAPIEIKNSFRDGILDKPIYAPSNVTIASYWALQAEHRGVELKVETIIKNNKGSSLVSGILQFTTDKEHTNYRTFVGLPTFPITGSGIYSVESILKNKQGEILAKGDTPITIELNSKEIDRPLQDQGL